jgi:aspartyl-tRNA(Asn)/glutamyl-tRNA(Gln) amidotransferase subunit A
MNEASATTCDFAALRARNALLNAVADWDETAQGGEGALAGMTFGVKANIAVAGMPFHAGIGALAGRIAHSDAATVAALRAAGAAVIATLHMEEGALGAKTDNPHFGPVMNPHRIGYTPGGSSGGSGAAVAAGIVDAALGTDTMGSVRIPASHCGVYGFKPATSRISQDGLEPADLSLDAIGVLARDLATLERSARVISDFGEGAISGSGATLEGHGVEVDSQVAQVFARACEALGAAPATARLTHPQSRIRWAGFISVSKARAAHLAGVEVSANLAKLLTYGPRRKEVDWAEDRQVLTATAAQVRALVAQHGFLILPTVPNLPFPHAQAEPAGQADFTCLANVAGLPALSLPAGWSDDGLPIGVQIIADEGAEAGLFALAAKLDKTLGAYRPPQSGDD